MPDKLHRRVRSALLTFALTLFAGNSAAAESPLVLLAQHLPREEMPAPSWQPLADYIAELTGRHCVIEMPPNFPSYWEALRHDRYDLALDAPHFTDYRAQKLGFTVLVKTAETASYSLIVRADARVRDPNELIGKRVASLGLLSIGTLRLNALFPNPIRQPVLHDVSGVAEGLHLLRAGKVQAAFLPTSLLGEKLAGRGIAVLLTTEPIPRLALSASPRLAPDLTARIRDGLLHARDHPAGRAMLAAIGLEYFDAATNADFANQSYVLKEYWGY